MEFFIILYPQPRKCRIRSASQREFLNLNLLFLQCRLKTLRKSDFGPFVPFFFLRFDVFKKENKRNQFALAICKFLYLFGFLTLTPGNLHSSGYFSEAQVQADAITREKRS